METPLLEELLNEESLNNLIQTTNSLQTLNILLTIKHQRIVSQHSKKLHFSINIYNKKTNDLGINILKTTLLVAGNVEDHIKQTKIYCFDMFKSCRNAEKLLYAFNLFNVILEHHKNQNAWFEFTQDEIETIHKIILFTLDGSSKPLFIFTLNTLLPNYVRVTTKNKSDLLLIEIFNFIKESKKLDIICISFDTFISSNLNDDCFSLVKYDEYWLLLMNCITTQNYSSQKQAIFLLTKSIRVSLKHPISKYLHLENINEAEIIWRNYLTLLEISSEKQLHIIEPALYMLESVLNLHFEWRLCLYKIFLKHPQNSVVYYTASFILKNETEWSNLSKIIEELLVAINKNEHSLESRTVFRKFGKICTLLNSNEFNLLLEKSLKVAWIPASVWSFYSNIFTSNTNFRLDSRILEDILRRLESVTQKFIRKSCTKVILDYFIRNYTIISVKDLLKDAHMLREFDKKLFENFIENNVEQIEPFIENLKTEFINSLKDEFVVHQQEVIIEILHKLQINILEILSNSSIATPVKKDHMFFSLLNLGHNPCDLENYLIERIDNVTDDEDVLALLSLCQTYGSEKITQKAFRILLDSDNSNYNRSQKCAAFSVVVSHTMMDLKPVTDLWKKNFLEKSTYDPKFTRFFLLVIFKHLTNSSEGDIVHFIEIFDDVLESESEESHIVFENISLFLKNIDQPIIFKFVEKCLGKFLVLCKIGVTKSQTEAFLSHLFSPDVLKNSRFCDSIIHFTISLSIATSSNALAYFLSRQIALLTLQSTEIASLFIPVVVDLILYGILVNKNEKVEYHVCQEISLMLNLKNNPNCRELATRLWGLDAMMNLVSVPENEDIVDNFVSLLLGKYMEGFSKRYFPDSQMHVQKLRIIQALLLLSRYITGQKNKVIDFIINSFLVESHQPSVKHLMQWLLILLSRNDKDVIILISEKLKLMDSNRPSTVSGLMPVLYHLVTYQDKSEWDTVVELFLPYTMGAHFKLRIFSQVALVKLYDKAKEKQFSNFLQKHNFLYNSLKQVVDATAHAHFDVRTTHHEFLDYFLVDTCDCSTIFYTIPKTNGVTSIEWENLDKFLDITGMKHIKFKHTAEKSMNVTDFRQERPEKRNIQKKITPWKDMLDNMNPNQCSNDFILVTSLIEKPANLGGLSRTCEVFGIKRMIMRTSKITADKEFKSLSMSSENWVDMCDVKVEDLNRFVLDIKKQGYTVIGAEQTSESVKLDEFRFPKMTVLVLGNEKEGIPPDLIPLLDACIEIPQFGMVRSLNVHVAGAIVMWEYCKQQKL